MDQVVRLPVFLVVAHRGASAYEPENTIRAFRKAVELGVDFVECDVRLTADGHAVVIHDETVNRTTNGCGRVRNMRLAELKQLDAGKGEKIPTLQEAVNAVKGMAGLVIEVKEPDAVGEVVRIVSENRLEDYVIISSFYHGAVKAVKKMVDNVKTSVIIASQPVNPAKLALDADADAIFCKWKYVNLEVVEEAHDNGLKVFSWTVDDPEIIIAQAKLGVDGVVTNKPDVALKQRVNL